MKTTLMCCLLFAASTFDLVASAATPIKIGLNYPTSGRSKADGIDEAQGAVLAVEQINAAGGVLGRPLELLTANTSSDPKKSVKNVKKLAKQGASMIFGGASSPVTIAGGKEARKHDLIYFGTLTYANQTTGSEGHSHMFRECHNAWMIGKALTRYIKNNLSDNRIFFITADYSWGNSTESSLREQAGLLDTQRHPGIKVRFPKPRQYELEMAMKAAAASGADTMVLIQGADDLVTSLRLLKSMDLRDKFTVIAPALTLSMARNAGAALLEGVIGTSPWVWSVPYQFDYKRGKNFVDAYVERYRQYPGSPAASAYNIVYEFKNAVERVGSLDTAKLIKTLEGHTYTGVKDPQTWRTFDHQSVQSVYVVKGRERKTVLASNLREDFFEVIDTVKGNEAARSYEEWLAARTKAGKPSKLE